MVSLVFRYLLLVILVGILEPFFTAAYRSLGVTWLPHEPIAVILYTATALFVFKVGLRAAVQRSGRFAEP